MPYADNRGMRIHYKVEGDGSPLVLQHGFTQSVEDWYECGYVDALKGDHKLVIIGARGHGDSDKPYDAAAYALENWVGDVVAVLNALAIEKADFWGYSMGSWIGFGMAEHAPERLDRLIIGGQHPYGRSQEGYRMLVQQGHDGMVAAIEQTFGRIPPGYKARLYEGDLKAWSALQSDREGIEGVLTRLPGPCLIYSGDADPVFDRAKQASSATPGATFLSLPGVNHGAAFFQSGLVLPLVTEFLRR
jgi:pimeloyl-ACP methyl ester carboxylesterase